MPNHITNRLRLEGDKERISELVEKYSTFHKAEPNKSNDGNIIYKRKTGEGEFDYEVGWLDIETDTFTRRDKEDVTGVPEGFEPDINEAWTQFPDFNKIVPMPDELHISHSSLGTMAQTLLFETGGDEWLGITELQERMKDRDTESRKEAVDLALQYQKNLESYGHITWYDWAIEHWGTKWNSYSCRQEDDGYYFETAWSSVTDLIEKISIEYPTVKIFYDWADEDTGYNCGSAVLYDGIVTIDKPEGGTKEAYELAFSLDSSKREYYELVNGNYEYAEE